MYYKDKFKFESVVWLDTKYYYVGRPRETPDVFVELFDVDNVFCWTESPVVNSYNCVKLALTNL